jgi:hypothetical protein
MQQCSFSPSSLPPSHTTNKIHSYIHVAGGRERERAGEWHHFSCQLHKIIIHLLWLKLIKHFFALFYKHSLVMGTNNVFSLFFWCSLLFRLLAAAVATCTPTCIVWCRVSRFMVEFFMNIHTTSTAQCDANMNAVCEGRRGEGRERAMKCFCMMHAFTFFSSAALFSTHSNEKIWRC